MEQRALWPVRAQIGGHGGRGGVHAVGRSRARARTREDAREEWGARHPLWRAGARVGVEQGAGHAVSMHGCHAPATCPPVEAFHRARVGQ